MGVLGRETNEGESLNEGQRERERSAHKGTYYEGETLLRDRRELRETERNKEVRHKEREKDIMHQW